MSLLIWTVVGVAAGFVVSWWLARRINHRIAPAALVAACAVALAAARWADAQADAMLQAQAFIVSCGLLGAVAGGVGWLIFARQRWAIAVSAVASVMLIVGLPVVIPFLARAAAGIGA